MQMMIPIFVALLLVSARALAAEQSSQEVPSSQTVAHSSGQQTPAVGVSQVETVPVSSVVEHVQHQPQAGVAYYHGQFHGQPSSSVGGVSGVNGVNGNAVHGMNGMSGVSSYYSNAAGLIQVVPSSVEQGSVVAKPVVGSGASSSSSSSSSSSPVVRHYASSVSSMPGAVVEQYGQPESASIPANYKPFGSWGLYIGGNPADGYYTNYYKSMAAGPSKEQPSSVVPSSAEQQVAVPKPGQQSPFMRQAFVPSSSSSSSSSPVGGVVQNGEPVYPYDHSYYTPADLSSGMTRFASPVHVAAGYGTPSASYEPSSSVMAYAADSYAVKRFAQPQKDMAQQQSVQQQQQSKGYQARSGYAYSAAQPGQQQQQQVVAYPVPVGSQMVGSQPGVDGAFYPYGVHAFTRYAVKPTVVSSGAEPQSVYYQPGPFAMAYPSYKQQQQPQQQQQVYNQYQPLGFYGYPLSQLHYSSGFSKPEQQSPVVGGMVGEPVVGYHSPVGMVVQPNEAAAASEKSETSHPEKPQTVVEQPKQQKKA